GRDRHGASPRRAPRLRRAGAGGPPLHPVRPCAARLAEIQVGRTALIVAVPEAEAAVGPLRLRHDSSAALGVPAHVTVLFPFAEGGEVDGAALAGLLGGRTAFDFGLDRIERGETGIVWLHPEPSRPFEELTAAVWRRWPDHPPYEGMFDTVIPHLTV